MSEYPTRLTEEEATRVVSRFSANIAYKEENEDELLSLYGLESWIAVEFEGVVADSTDLDDLIEQWRVVSADPQSAYICKLDAPKFIEQSGDVVRLDV